MVSCSLSWYDPTRARTPTTSSVATISSRRSASSHTLASMVPVRSLSVSVRNGLPALVSRLDFSTTR